MIVIKAEMKKKKKKCVPTEKDYSYAHAKSASITLSRSLIGSQALLNSYTLSFSSYLSILHLSYFEINAE